MSTATRNITSIDEEILPLLCEACQYSPSNFKRKKCLTKIIRIIQKSNKLWYEYTPYYEDALQQTWLYFCQNACEAGSGKQFDPSRSSIITWLNQYLKWRLQDFRINNNQYLVRFHYSNPQRTANKTADIHSNIAAPPDIPPIWELTLQWVEMDASGDLRNTHILNRPDVNCQVLLLRRLFLHRRWEEISLELDLSISTLSSFYQRQCIPHLRNFGKLQGFL